MTAPPSADPASTGLPARARNPHERRETIVLATTLGALLLGSGTLLALWIHHSRPENLRWLWVQVAGIATFPGKYVIFSGLSANSPMGPLGLALLALLVDTQLTLVLALFLGPLGRLPWLGPWLKQAHDRAGELLAEYPGLKRMAFWGTALFVFLPLPGTGAIGGTFASQIVGLSRPMGVLAVAVGTLGIVLVFAGVALTMGAETASMFDSAWVKLGSAVVMGLVLWLGYRMARERLRRP